MSQRAFLIWLTLLGTVAALLLWLLHGGPETPSVGGGGYDLGPFVYGWLLTLLSGGWIVGAGLAGLGRRDRKASLRAFALAVVGLAVLVLTLILHGSDLN
ncbi:hypothetical protein [Pseudotabrizicola alkalilacus]|uniref:Uncharacterized protein n=1 Tax=Pseudotabrizicola alkalilacus TaxID=2305252 RepID=A0A411YZM4_9RHOB|nr:hypothetical protein [Pseudotabrizicola alkalilacus]RGP36248.1 hypothetical protein D1012_15790 [Pseudotabrizicola alkalilacus]